MTTKPERKYFPEGVKGTVEFLRARNAYTDEVTEQANRAFARQFGWSLGD